jgi:hypothetical protein
VREIELNLFALLFLYVCESRNLRDTGMAITQIQKERKKGRNEISNSVSGIYIRQ